MNAYVLCVWFSSDFMLSKSSPCSRIRFLNKLFNIISK